MTLYLAKFPAEFPAGREFAYIAWQFGTTDRGFAMTPVTWRLNPLSYLSWRRWGDDWVAFDAGSDDTHQLDPVAAVALMCFEEGPHDLPSLRAQIAVELDLPNDDQLSRRLADLVHQFTQLGLIEPTAP